MKKVILMAAVAMLFATTAAAQGKVTTAKGNAPATTATTCKKDAKCPNAQQCQGKKIDAQAAKQGTANTAVKENNKTGNTAAKRESIGGKKTANTQAATKVEK